MKSNIKLFFVFISFISATQVMAISHSAENVSIYSEPEIIQTHHSVRSLSLQIRLDDDLHGFVESKTCGFCGIIKIKITPNTKAYANNISVPLEHAKSRVGRYATVTYELNTKKVSTISW